MSNVSPPAGARRRAAPAASRGSSATAVAGVLLVAAAVASTVLTPRPADVAPATAGRSGTPVTDALVACPEQEANEGTTTRFLVGSLPFDSLDGTGRVLAGPVGSDSSTVDLGRGELAELPADEAPQVSARGSLAAGLFAVRTDVGDTVAVSACAAPRPSWWFTGAGASLDHSSTLVVANVDPGPAVIDIRVLGQDGPVETVGTRGITVAPGTVETISLADVAPQTEEGAVQVLASRGRVVAAMSDTSTAAPAGGPTDGPGDGPADGPGDVAVTGNEWVPAQPLPSRSVRLTGLPAKATTRTLLVGNPSDREAVIEVEVSAEAGGFAPAGLEDLTVAPGAVGSFDLSDAIAEEVTAVRVSSPVPVTAGVRSATEVDTTYAAPVAPLSGAAAAPLLVRAAETVQLTAGAVEAVASVVTYDAEGAEVDSTRLTIPPRATQGWQPQEAAAYVVVTPERGAGSGAVHGAVSYARDGGGVSALALASAPVRVRAPEVLPALQ